MSRSPLPFNRLLALDKAIHEPARLAILTALAACHSASFTYLQALTGLTQGNLHVHLAKMKDRGFVELEKDYAGGYSNTSVRLTPLGARAIARHWQQLADLKQVADQLVGDEEKADRASEAKPRQRARR
jgi:DNA-binding MarR family transcriptional regulator